MAYEVILYKPARRYLERCDRPTQKRLIARLEELAADPYRHGKRLQDREGRYSNRVGDLRIIYRPDDETQTLRVYLIGSRGDVYDRI